jgi:hypothetical protein
VTVTPTLRGEGYTEQTGDVTLTCTGGSVAIVGNATPLVNITVFYNSTVTSRLLPYGSGASEALLLVDEPGSGLPGYGPTLGQQLCTTPLSGCTSTIGQTTYGGVVIQTPMVGSAPAPNVFQGIVNGNAVTFFGVPALPPTSTGSRVYRITNVRVNATTLSGGSSSGAQPVVASISISGATSLSISQSSLSVGYVQSGLTASVSGATTSLKQCSSYGNSPSPSFSGNSVALLNFAENFGTAFKTRVVPQTNSNYAGQINNPGVTDPYPGATVVTPNQNTPGAIYNSESNFILPLSTGGTAGLADYGTRLKAIFNNIPNGVNVYVSVNNVVNGSINIIQNTPGGMGTGSFAQLVNGETTNDGNAGISGFFPMISGTINSTLGSNTTAQVPITNNTGTAVWEVVNTNPNFNETISFAVFLSYTANVSQSSPAIGTSTVNLSYAPTATSGAASATLTIPRFVPDSSAARTLFGIILCRTILLYPFVTNQGGFDTGLTVANTSQDPFTVGGNVTAAQAGSCNFTWYGGTTQSPTTPPTPSNTGSIAGGTVWAGLASNLVPAFQGYAFAVCNFQYAHGFAFVSDIGARNLAMGYLAVVIQDPGTGGRSASPSCQGISGCPSNGEAGSH